MSSIEKKVRKATGNVLIGGKRGRSQLSMSRSGEAALR